MAGLISYGLLAGLVGGLALALLAIIISVLMRQIFKSWTAPRLATFSSAFGPVLLGIPILALSLSVVSGMILVSGPEAQGFVALFLAMTPRGKPLTQARVRELAQGPGVTICAAGSRALTSGFSRRAMLRRSRIGDIVLSGGEPAALMLLDACIRLLPGVMGAASSGAEESFEQRLARISALYPTR
jgi:hypothetical protein